MQTEGESELTILKGEARETECRHEKGRDPTANSITRTGAETQADHGIGSTIVAVGSNTRAIAIERGTGRATEMKKDVFSATAIVAEMIATGEIAPGERIRGTGRDVSSATATVEEILVIDETAREIVTGPSVDRMCLRVVFSLLRLTLLSMTGRGMSVVS